MSEENKVDAESATIPVIEDADWFLQDLVSFINSVPTISHQISLLVGGIIVAGELVSGKTYFEEFSKAYANAFERFGEGLRDKVKAYYNQLTEIYVLKPDDNGSSLSPARTGYIHLKNARFFHPSGAPIPSNQGVLWRGKIAAVDGFWLGEMRHIP